MAPAAKNSKPIFKTSSPFTETKWPEISPHDQDIILDLVCNLLAPLGEHRKTHIQPSKGKKRKRKSQEQKHSENQNDTSAQHDSTPLPAPEIGKHILVGINSITRHLEALAARIAPPSMPVAASRNDQQPQATTDDDNMDDVENDPNPLSILILTHPKPSLSPSHAHFPTLIHLSNLHPPSSTTPSPPTLLIPLATPSDARLASTLHIPRVGALAIFAGAPGAKALEEFVREKVDVTECRWVDEAMGAEWRGVNVKCEGMGVGKIGKGEAMHDEEGGKEGKGKATKDEKGGKEEKTKMPGAGEKVGKKNKVEGKAMKT
ncbi:hypothetical protein BKA63DRAFT_608347 [Paraphoma chrysanthemicola]|nr:hypothetical protein BKA63DRAFT_608347 [Paraphoma chrysanthemicola]